MKKNRSNQMIEIIRFVSCVVILLIHCELPGCLGRLLNHYGRFAVPFFLLTSGYFAYGTNLSEKSAKKGKQTLSVIGIHGSLCLLWNCINSFLSTGSFTEWLVPYFTIKHLQNFVFYNRAVIFNSAFYYLFMLLYVYAFCQIICKLHISIRYVYVIALFLFLVGYYKYQFTPVRWYEIGNFLFTGIPLFFLGYFLHEKKSFFLVAKGKEIPIMLLGFIITYLERIFLGGTYLSIGQITIAASLLCFCVNNSNIKFDVLAMLGSCSLYIMLYHCQVRDTARVFIGLYPFRVALATLIISISVAVLIDSIKLIIPAR